MVKSQTERQSCALLRCVQACPGPHGFVFPAQGLSKAYQGVCPLVWPAQCQHESFPEGSSARTRRTHPSSETWPDALLMQVQVHTKRMDLRNDVVEGLHAD